MFKAAGAILIILFAFGIEPPQFSFWFGGIGLFLFGLGVWDLFIPPLVTVRYDATNRRVVP
jgi:hypothetical protein